MIEATLQTVILILPIYALLTILIITHTRREQSITLPHHRWGKPRRKNKTRRRRTHIRRQGPGEFIIEEEEKRPRGKPKGGKGGARHKPEKVDNTRTAYPKKCPRCGAKIPKNLKPRRTHQRTVIDLEEVERGLIGTRTLWEVQWVRCPNCGKLASGGDAVNAEKGYTYGYGIIAYTLHQHIEHGTPPTEIAENLRDLLREDAPTAQTIRNWINHTAQKNKTLTQNLLRMAKKEKHMEVDETGLPMDGKKNWLWIISTKTATIYLARKTRGHQAIAETLKRYTGILIADFWKAYGKLPHRKQRSLSHLSRRVADTLKKQVETINKLLEELEESEENQRGERNEEKPKRARGRPKKLRILDEEQKAQHVHRIAELGASAEALYSIMSLLKEAVERKVSADQAKTRMLTLIEENQPAESFNDDYRRISKLIREHIDELFLFLEEPGLPSSTNTAEREFKPFACAIRRRTPCYRSPVSAEADADLLSYSTTWKKAGLDPRELYPLLVRGLWREAYRLIERAFKKPPPETGVHQATKREVTAAP